MLKQQGLCTGGRLLYFAQNIRRSGRLEISLHELEPSLLFAAWGWPVETLTWHLWCVLFRNIVYSRFRGSPTILEIMWHNLCKPKCHRIAPLGTIWSEELEQLILASMVTSPRWSISNTSSYVSLWIASIDVATLSLNSLVEEAMVVDWCGWHGLL